MLGTMPPPLALVLAALAGLAAALLSPWMRTVAESDSRWLSCGLHTLLAAFGGLGAVALARTHAEAVAFTLLSVSLAILFVIDLAVHRLPDRIVGPTYPVLVAALAVAAGSSGEWSRFGRAGAAGAVLVVAYFVLAFISPSGLGLGDVKLAGLLGLLLGWLGWPHVLLGTLAAFILGGLFAVVLLLLRRASGKSHFAFGPFMIAGAVVGAAWGPRFLSG